MMTCPRRRGDGALSPVFVQGGEGRDQFDRKGECTYCGSISEEMFLAAMERGDRLTPTDKNYKVYVDLPEDHPEELVVVGTSNSKERPGPDWVLHTGHTTRKDGMELRQGEWVLLAARGKVRYSKFYFQHLGEAGQKKFIELHNAQKLTLALPGHFYVRPFFCGVPSSSNNDAPAAPAEGVSQ